MSNEEIFLSVGFIIGGIMGYLFKHFLIERKIGLIRDVGRQNFEMEQRLWEQERKRRDRHDK